MGFIHPPKTQENTLPLMLAEALQNLVALSQSGTAEAAAFVLVVRLDTPPSVSLPDF